MSDVPLWLSILLYAVAALAIAAVLYLLIVTALRAVLREPLAEMRTARRRQEDLLREIAGSAGYLADVADVWAEREAERVAAASGATSPAGAGPAGERPVTADATPADATPAAATTADVASTSAGGTDPAVADPAPDDATS